ncbi:hypothetical protein SLEP1_g24281 [Rubroshorea leprosula]|uniref:Protein kinase domain-containing protein n=1 Tax=Rubroshorea leprosula TaxID=152421 RepID=A0AAV5JQL7_9ROSI|nr:hypothetical protein SLEP1_g24281 [Rubroshorea leprosula]
MENYSVFFFIFCSVLLPVFPLVRSGDADALLALKLWVDPLNSLPWQGSSDVCTWKGIKECMNGRITKLVLEYYNLSGTLEEKSLNQLDQLRVLSFKGNSISGQIPRLSGLVNLKSLYLNNNNFSGAFPESVSGLHRLKVIVLAENQISGPIPASLLNLRRLYMLYLQDNRLNGTIPPFNQTSLRFFNVSVNQLSGEIPATPALIRFNISSYSGNVGLCGEEIQNPCASGSGPAISPAYPILPNSKSSSKSKKLIKIIAGSVGGFLFLLLICLLCLYIISRKNDDDDDDEKVRGKGQGIHNGGAGAGAGAEEGGGSDMGKPGGFSWEGEGLGSLVFLGSRDERMSYSLEDLLKASAETLGRGTMGSTYKAVMESGFIVTVKRLKNAKYPRSEEFRRHVDLLGRLRHPNLVPLRAYFQAKEERLLVYDYFPNGSLYTLIHGTRGSDGGKPLHWTSCLKIAEDLAAGLLYIHQNPGLTHGNLKSSNVLLGPEFESCLTDYGLASFRDPDSLDESTSSTLFYKAPEYRHVPTQQADIYSFGVLLLELLTGKTPFQDLVCDHRSDIPRWVKSVRDQETDSGDDPNSSNEASEDKLQALLNTAVACVSPTPENRPVMREILKMIRDARAEVQVSSNSSDHSPGRWSDTVQSLPRDEHLSI